MPEIKSRAEVYSRLKEDRAMIQACIPEWDAPEGSVLHNLIHAINEVMESIENETR